MNDSQDKEKDEDKVSSLFDKARKAGATQGTSDDLAPQKGGFAGSGRTVAGGASQVRRNGGGACADQRRSYALQP